MTIAYADFIAAWPQFATTPEAQVQFWIDRAYALLDAIRWADQLDFGVTLYVAHMITLSQKAVSQKGSVVGVASSKSVGGVSVSYDTGSVTIRDAGSYNATIYGIQFYELVLMIGSSGLQLTGGAEYSNGEGTGVMDKLF